MRPTLLALRRCCGSPPSLIGSSVTCIDGSAKGCPAACEGIFRYNNANFLGGFVVNLHITTAFQVELHGLMNAIEIAYKKSRSRL
jgi:hypothetical protein